LGFFYWAGVGFLVVFGFITGFSIGLPILALGAVLFVVMLRRGPGWPADLGLLAGAGLVCLVIAMINVISGIWESARTQSEVSPPLSAATWAGLMPIDSAVLRSLNQAKRA
jgi:hypothetical protein